jgi:hypothetical protein
MSRIGDCLSANNHQLVWMDMTRPILTGSAITSSNHSALSRASRRLVFSDFHVSPGPMVPNGVPAQGVDTRKLGSFSSCVEVGSK